MEKSTRFCDSFVGEKNKLKLRLEKVNSEAWRMHWVLPLRNNNTECKTTSNFSEIDFGVLCQVWDIWNIETSSEAFMLKVFGIFKAFVNWPSCHIGSFTNDRK